MRRDAASDSAPRALRTAAALFMRRVKRASVANGAFGSREAASSSAFWLCWKRLKAAGSPATAPSASTASS